MITLRHATHEDARVLFEWRNDPATRAASLSPQPVRWEDHLCWLNAVLEDAGRQLMIAEHDGQAIGTLRADSGDGVTELSWTVAPDARGKGLAKPMVQALRDRVSGPVCARVRSDNAASIRIAEHIGLILSEEQDGVLFYR